SSSTKGPERKISFTKVKAIGVVKKKIASHKFLVDWISNNQLPMDFEQIWYSQTIESIREDALKTYVLKSVFMNEQQKITDLLLYKKQIILQGPPGTGKTRLAKEIAKNLTKPKALEDNLDKIDNFFKNFNPKDPKVQENRRLYSTQISDFYKRFPKEKLSSIDIEEYWEFYNHAIRGIKSLYTSDYHADLVDYHRRRFVTRFNKFPKFKNAKDDKEAMALLASMVSKLILDKDILATHGGLTDFISLKFLICYYPDEFFPVHDKDYLK